MHKFNHDFSCILAIFAVSLFTREWIEMFFRVFGIIDCTSSPSLRGSGLKLNDFLEMQHLFCLPLYEGVDWNCQNGVFHRYKAASPSLRGSGLKSTARCIPSLVGICLPLYEGVDWNIKHMSCLQTAYSRSPSLRGSGLKLHFVHNPSPNCLCLPLYEGVDWNKISFVSIVSPPLVSLFTREWIEMWHLHTELQRKSKSPSLRGSGLKSWSSTLVASTIKVSLFTREWIEIANLPALLLQQPRLPLYEGVDWNK